MIHLILLAAGSSQRFGTNKLLWEVDGQPMLLHAANRLVEVSSHFESDVTIVTREGAHLSLLENSPARVLLNPDHAQGISASVRRAVHALDDGAPLAFFVADQPYLCAETIVNFLCDWRRSGKELGCVSHRGETGNPAVFSSRYSSELAQLEGDRGGKRVLRRHPDDCFFFEIEDPRELEDVDFMPQ